MGQQLWHYESDSGILEPPVATQETIYFTTERAAYAADTTDGTIRWEYNDGFRNAHLQAEQAECLGA